MKKAGKKKIVKKEALIEVSATVLGGVKADEKKIKIRPFATETAIVGVKLGATLNMGDYSSAKIDVFVSCPAYVEEARSVLEQCYSLADEYLSEKVKEVKGG